MSQFFVRQIDKLKALILKLGGYVEQSLQQAIQAIETRDVALAQTVIANDERIDLLEVDVEEECLHTIALYHPVASDMRFVLAVIKINTDLERIGDLAAHMAEQAVFLAEEPAASTAPFDFEASFRQVWSMVKTSLDALVTSDVSLAQEVRKADEKVDAAHRKVYQRVEAEIRKNPQEVRRLIDLMNISRQLERIADHAVNIAEDVIFMVTGEIHRHEEEPLESKIPRR